jgi:hypothetical protein
VARDIDEEGFLENEVYNYKTLDKAVYDHKSAEILHFLAKNGAEFSHSSFHVSKALAADNIQGAKILISAGASVPTVSELKGESFINSIFKFFGLGVEVKEPSQESLEIAEACEKSIDACKAIVCPGYEDLAFCAGEIDYPDL